MPGNPIVIQFELHAFELEAIKLRLSSHSYQHLVEEGLTFTRASPAQLCPILIPVWGHIDAKAHRHLVVKNCTQLRMDLCATYFCHALALVEQRDLNTKLCKCLGQLKSDGA